MCIKHAVPVCLQVLAEYLLKRCLPRTPKHAIATKVLESTQDLFVQLNRFLLEESVGSTEVPKQHRPRCSSSEPLVDSVCYVMSAWSLTCVRMPVCRCVWESVSACVCTEKCSPQMVNLI